MLNSLSFVLNNAASSADNMGLSHLRFDLVSNANALAPTKCALSTAFETPPAADACSPTHRLDTSACGAYLASSYTTSTFFLLRLRTMTAFSSMTTSPDDEISIESDMMISCESQGIS